jgi:hypothetical protein
VVAANQFHPETPVPSGVSTQFCSSPVGGLQINLLDITRIIEPHAIPEITVDPGAGGEKSVGEDILTW